jgi:hypothetical protein
LEKVLSQDEITENCNRPADIFVEWQRGRLQGTWKKAMGPGKALRVCHKTWGASMWYVQYCVARRDNYGVRRIMGGMTRDDRGMTGG